MNSSKVKSKQMSINDKILAQVEKVKQDTSLKKNYTKEFDLD